MKTVVPDYYEQFQCIADQCRHTCCVGWEIDVDEQALARYEQIPGALGEKLHTQIVRDECPHFRLTKEERCPFLNEQNLCELIVELGEESLCQICTDHPRFRNELSDRTEVGLGLCCEAAAALILGRTEKMQLLEEDDGEQVLQDNFEAAVLKVRDQAFCIMQNRNNPFWQRIEQLLAAFQVRLPEMSNEQWAKFFMELERLDDGWSVALKQFQAAPEWEQGPILEKLEVPFEQLALYFLYRHLPAAQDETELKARLAFAVLSCRILYVLCQTQAQDGGCSLEDLQELARLYSSEIEYSEENTDAILTLLWQENE